MKTHHRVIGLVTQDQHRDLIVRRVHAEDINMVLSILTEAAEWLQQRGINQWPSPFPRDEVEQRFATGAIYLAFVDKQPIATFALFTSDLENWGEQAPDALYLHGLAVRRTHAGQGIGRELLRHAETLTRASGKRWLRLDCWAGNEKLRRFYEAAGFRDCGVVQVPIGAEVWNCRLFEKAVA